MLSSIGNRLIFGIQKFKMRSSVRRISKLSFEILVADMNVGDRFDDEFYIKCGLAIRKALIECPDQIPKLCSIVLRSPNHDSSSIAEFFHYYATYWLNASKENWSSAHKALDDSRNSIGYLWLRKYFAMPFVPEYKRYFKPQVVSMY